MNIPLVSVILRATLDCLETLGMQVHREKRSDADALSVLHIMVTVNITRK